MNNPNNSNHHPFAWVTEASPEVRHELLNSPITYEVVMMIAVVSFAMLLLWIMQCLLSCIAPDGYFDEEEEDDGEAQPWNVTLTADGNLLDSEAGRQPCKYGTFSLDKGKWYSADGKELSYNDWIEAVYDPLD